MRFFEEGGDYWYKLYSLFRVVVVVQVLVVVAVTVAIIVAVVVGVAI